MIPSNQFDCEEHSYVSDKDFNNFSCDQCEFSSTSEQMMIKHMEKKRKESWTQMLEEKIKCDKRFQDWYDSPSDFKHLSVKHNLPNPNIENENDDKEHDFATPETSKAERVPHGKIGALGPSNCAFHPYEINETIIL